MTNTSTEGPISLEKLYERHKADAYTPDVSDSSAGALAHKHHLTSMELVRLLEEVDNQRHYLFSVLLEISRKKYTADTEFTNRVTEALLKGRGVIT